MRSKSIWPALQPDKITEAMNQACSEIGEGENSLAARRALEKSEWPSSEGEICLADLPAPTGPDPGFRRTVTVIGV